MIRNPAPLPLVHWLLAPLSWAYAAAIRLRNARYDRNPRASQAVGLPVISVGNITVGGTGKTPIVVEIVRRLQQLGRRPAILTRGYGAATGQAADEVLEFAEALPDVPVAVDPDRLAGAETARAQFGADCLVLDDGFQYRRLRRDLDVVVVDALDPWGGGSVLPAGRLREPLGSLARADLFAISRANQGGRPAVEEVSAVLQQRAPDAVILCADVEPESVVYRAGRADDPGVLAYHCVLPVCGIGNPATFLRSIEQLAGRVCPALLFRDHQRYTRRHARQIVEVARRRGADLVVTTRKDWVKLAPFWPQVAADDADPQLARLDVRVELRDEDGVFDEHLRRVLEGSR